MNIIILGAAGFIGTNLVLALVRDHNNKITLVDENLSYFNYIRSLNIDNIVYVEQKWNKDTNFDALLQDQNIVYHLVSSSMPINSNQHIPQEIETNVLFTSFLMESCIRNKVDKIVFVSSGGTVYGKYAHCPIDEDQQNYPISSYGFQKLAIEKLLYLYNYIYGIDCYILRLANPFGPFQRPNGKLGVVTTFIYKTLKNEVIIVYGDGSIVRDYIYIEDAITAMLNIVNYNTYEGNSTDSNKQNPLNYSLYNIGSGIGHSVRDVINTISSVLNKTAKIEYLPGREVDVPVNVLNIRRYEKKFGKICNYSFEEGIKRTAVFLKQTYDL